MPRTNFERQAVTFLLRRQRFSFGESDTKYKMIHEDLHTFELVLEFFL